MQDHLPSAPQPYEWRTLSSAEDLVSERLKRLLLLWTSRRPSDGRLPDRRDFGTRELIGFGGCIALIDVERDPLRFRFRMIGSMITAVLDRDSTGRYLDELYSEDDYETSVGGYMYCVQKRLPARGTGAMKHAGKDFVPFGAVDLPLASNGSDVDMIMKGVDFTSVPIPGLPPV